MNGWTVDVNAWSKPENGQGAVPFRTFRALGGATVGPSTCGQWLHGSKNAAANMKRREASLRCAVIEVTLSHRSQA